MADHNIEKGLGKSVGLLFPGQGTQAIGMGQWAFEQSAKARDIAHQIQDVLEFPITDIMFQGPEETLLSTLNTQLAIFTSSLMMLAVLEERLGAERMADVKACAGHSVGEYTALAAAHVLPLPDVTKLLRARAEAMERAVPRGNDGTPTGTMCALLGIELEKVQELLAKHCPNDPKQCCLGNDNCPGQVVISGSKEGVDMIRSYALEAGAKRGVILNVSGPFHSPWMEPVSRLLTIQTSELDFHKGRFPVISNVTAKPVDKPEDWKQYLPAQVTHPVRWREIVAMIAKDFHITACIEVGHGHVLTNLGKRCEPDGSFFTLEEALAMLDET